MWHYMEKALHGKNTQIKKLQIRYKSMYHLTLLVNKVQ